MKAAIKTTLFAATALIAASCSDDGPKETVTPNVPQSEIEQDLYASQVEAGERIYWTVGGLGYSRIAKFEIDGKCLGYGENEKHSSQGRTDKHLVVSADGATVKISLNILGKGADRENMKETDFVPRPCNVYCLATNKNNGNEYVWKDPENTENPYPEIFGTIRRLSESSFEVVIPPNESGVMRDYDVSFTDKELSQIDYFGELIDVYKETYIGMQQLPSAHPSKKSE